MNWDAIGALAEAVGAIAVIATLFYLAHQIRQSTAATRISNYHEAQQQLWSAAESIATDAVLSSEISASIDQGWHKVAPENQARMEFILGSFFFGMENMLALYERGQIDSEQWQNVFDNNFRFVGSALGREYIANRPGAVSRRLEKLINGQSQNQI